MSDSLRNGLIRFALIAILACYYVGGLGADAPRPKPPSEFAPLDDLTFDLERRISTLETARQVTPAETESVLSLHEEAQLIAIVASQLALHDQRSASEAAIATSPTIVGGADELTLLARHFPECFDQLRIGIFSSRFAHDQTALAARSATLALLAQYCGQQEHCCPNHAQQKEWERACFHLRDSAREVNLACHAGSQTAAAAAVNRLERSCVAWQAVALSRPE